MRQTFYRILPILGGVANIIFAWAFDTGKLGAQSFNDFGGIIHGEGRLGHISQLIGIFHQQTVYILLILNQINLATMLGVLLSHGAFNFRVTGMANQNAFDTFTAGSGYFHMDFSH